MQLILRGNPLGSSSFSCSGNYSAVATFKLKRDAARKLSKKLAKKRSLPLLAKFTVGTVRLSARLTLRKTGAKAGKATGGFWNSGWLSCGRDWLLINPGLRLATPGVSASGVLENGGEWFNDTPYDNWVTYRTWIYEWGVGWIGSTNWQPWQYAGPYVDLFQFPLDFLMNVADGSDRYLAAATYVWWWNGYKDWNYMLAGSPYFGFPVHESTWCHTI